MPRYFAVRPAQLWTKFYTHVKQQLTLALFTFLCSVLQIKCCEILAF
jgi:hypothetical protein